MNESIYHIPILRLFWIFIPVVIVAGIYGRWSLNVKMVGYATLRMVTQLVLIGYVLNLIFFQSKVIITSLVLVLMLLAAAWIAARPLKELRRQYYGKALWAIAVGGVPTLGLVIGGVIRLDPWHVPQYIIPLAGMIFANTMNSVSLAAERFHTEEKRGVSFIEARNRAYEASLLPLMNSLLAVGIGVSFGI
jgi:putative ABC transport system permease protein